MFKYLKDRMREKSTYLGMMVLLSVLGIELSPEQKDAIMQALMAIAGVVLVFSKEKA